MPKRGETPAAQQISDKEYCRWQGKLIGRMVQMGSWLRTDELHKM
jgi:hypothetical protein